MIDKSKTYRTRDGREARIYATDAGGSFPVHGSVLGTDGIWDQHSWKLDGSSTGFGAASRRPLDLIEVVPLVEVVE
jgi:hypothetical protein